MKVLNPADIVEMRKRLDMNQAEFAKTFRINLWTLRNWEQGRTKPSGAAAVLLWLLTRIPEQILEVMKRK